MFGRPRRAHGVGQVGGVQAEQGFELRDGGVGQLCVVHRAVDKDALPPVFHQAGGELLVGQALLVETGHPHIRWCISAPTMRVPTLLDTPLPAYLATRAAVRCALDAGLESVAIPGMGTGTGGLAPREAAAAMLWGIRDALYPPAFPASLADVLSF